MKRVVTAQRMRELDAALIDKIGIPGAVLMERAACHVADAVLRRSPRRVLILCGKGNNGGDGLAALRILAERGIAAQAILLGAADRLCGDALLNYAAASRLGLNVAVAGDIAALNDRLPAALSAADVVVDAIFGTGLCRTVGELEAEAIAQANQSGAYKIAVDVPSGVNSDTAAVMGIAFRADETVCLQHLKRGHVLYPGREYAGNINVCTIAYDPGALQSGFTEHILEEEDIRSLLPKRKENSNKGDYGRGLILAGSEGLSGAAVMSACAALRSGVGLLNVACPQSVCAAMAAVPEAMTRAVSCDDWRTVDAELLLELLLRASAAAIGPGMGKNGGVAQVIMRALEKKKPLVIDADALNVLAEHEELLPLLNAQVVLTPHPGEMSRLLHFGKAEILASPAAVAASTAKQWGCTVLLKGTSSVIAAPDGRVCYNLTGNSGLAKGGSGDVLTGIILALLAQGMPAFEAACVGAYLLGCSAQKAFSMLALRAMMARDVTESIRETLKFFDAEVCDDHS